MKNSSVRNSNGMKAENNSVENLKNVAFTSSRNGSSLEEEKICDVSKPKRHSGKTSSISLDAGDKKQTGSETSKLTYTAEDGIHYEPGDCVYIDSQRPDVPFFICSVKEFRLSKRDNLVVVVRWYYRPSEVPDSVYQLLVQDRNHEHGSRDHILGDEAVKERELFISDATDVYPAIALKGKCKVRPFSDVCQSLKEFIAHTDCFFYVLGYNPETRRLANTKGEIRVGPSHQASIPDCIAQKVPKPLYCNGSFEVKELPKEKLVWRPQMEDCDLKLFLRAARSIAQYAGMCNGGTPEDGFRALQQDATTSNALSVLHESGYDTGKALQVLVKRPYPKELRSKWTEDDTKKFVKGLRQFGKNFFKIKKELLHHKETSELVEYYYMWKKTQSALSSRPHRRRRHNVLKRKVHTRASRNPSNIYIDLSSCSENDSESEDSERDMRLYCCRHCFTDKCKSWHHGGQNKVILCVECRLFYKKYGKLPNVDEPRDPPSFMFKSTAERDLRDEESLYYLNNGKHGLRSRRGAVNSQSTLRSGKLKSSSPVEGLTLRESQINGRRLSVKMSKPASPSSGSTSSSISTSSMTSKEKKKGKSKKSKQGKRIRDQSPDSQSGAKRKRPSAQESEDEAEDSCDTNGSLGGRDSVNLPENDASSVCSNSSNNEDRCNNRSPSPALPLVDSLPPKRFARIIPSEDGRSCTRTDCIFIYQKSETAAPPRESSRTTASASNEVVVKTEASESSSERNLRPSSRKTPEEKPATITSHFESLRNMIESGGYPMFPPHIPVINSPSGAIPIPAGISSHGSSLGEYRMMPTHMYPGAAAMFGARDVRDSGAKYAEGFEQWYAPFRAQVQAGQHGAIPFWSGSAMEPSSVASRGIPGSAHEALMNRVQGRGITVDPVTGLPVPYPGQHHSHSHLHTHFHMYPHEQLRALQAQGIDPAYLQAHPELLAWRNSAALWHPEALMHLHGNGSRGMVSPDELSTHPPIHALGSTPLDRHLQQQLFLNQQSKYHQQALQQQHMFLEHEAQIRHLRHHHELQLKQRLEEANINERYLAMRSKEQRNLQSPSQLDNVVKKNLDSSGAYTSPSKRPITIELSDD